jgi:hypothetical protein
VRSSIKMLPMVCVPHTDIMNSSAKLFNSVVDDIGLEKKVAALFFF